MLQVTSALFGLQNHKDIEAIIDAFVSNYPASSSELKAFNSSSKSQNKIVKLVFLVSFGVLSLVQVIGLINNFDMCSLNLKDYEYKRYGDLKQRLQFVCTNETSYCSLNSWGNWTPYDKTSCSDEEIGKCVITE
jgi:hypothetical protein